MPHHNIANKMSDFYRHSEFETIMNVVPCEQQVLIELAINSGDFW
jgi:hypothetical protein